MKVQLDLFFGEDFSLFSCDEAAVNNEPDGLLQFKCRAGLTRNGKRLTGGDVFVVFRGGLKDFVACGKGNDMFGALCFDIDVAARRYFSLSRDTRITFYGSSYKCETPPLFEVANSCYISSVGFDVVREDKRSVTIALDLEESVARGLDRREKQ